MHRCPDVAETWCWSSSPFCRLSPELIRLILRQLCSSSRTPDNTSIAAIALRVVAACCQGGYRTIAGFPFVPGLREGLELFPHQVAAVHRCASPIAPLCILRGAEMTHIVPAEQWRYLWLRMKAIEAGVCNSSVRGGIECDEPGLGKTVTALALVARTLAPADVHRSAVTALSVCALRYLAAVVCL